MKSKTRAAAISLAATCALAGAAAGISEGSAASSSSSSKSTTTTPRNSTADFPPGGRGHGPGGPGDHSVHEVEAVLNKAGTAYISQTVDEGTITAVDTSAGTITLKEGTSTVTYATPTITIPSGATVQLDESSSSLEKLAVGDHVSIASSSDGTTVFATDSSFHPSGGPGMGGGQPPTPPSSGSGSSSSAG